MEANILAHPSQSSSSPFYHCFTFLSSRPLSSAALSSRCADLLSASAIFMVSRSASPLQRSRFTFRFRLFLFFLVEIGAPPVPFPAFNFLSA
jgi:hypothetical protein